MNEFIADYCHRYDDRINRDMFERSYDRPLVDYIVDTCKNLEVIPGLTLEDWWLVRDQTKIRSVINKKNAKDPKIKNNKTLERLAQPNKTLYDLLYLKFRIKAKGRDETIIRTVRILKPIRGGLYIRNGNKVRVLNQVVDNSTFVKGNVLNFKTKLYPIKLSTIKSKLKFTDGETAASCACFRLDLLSKVVNPLIYYLAQYGIGETIERFSLGNVMSVVDSTLDEDHYMYVHVNKNVYVEVHEKAFYAHEFVAAFTATLVDILKSDKEMTFKDAHSIDYWRGRLSEVFSKRRYVNKALRVLVSFNKIVDVGIRKSMVIRKHHRQDTFSIIRWMMTNYGELLKKDAHDLRYKRVRENETLAYLFDKHVSKNVYSLLNTDNPPFDKYVRLLYSINEYTLLKGAHGGGKTSSGSMFRDERYNDFDAIERSRFTLKGPTGLNGGKKGITWRYRDVYPRHMGRYDINVCSSSDPGLTGYLCANVKLGKNGYFDPKDAEPDSYDPVIEVLLDRYVDPDYRRLRDDYIDRRVNADEDGFVVLRRKKTAKQIQDAIMATPWKYGLYRFKDTDGKHALKLLPRQERGPDGFVVLRDKRKVRGGSFVVDDNYDEDGFYVLHRTVTKYDRYLTKKEKEKRGR